MDLSRIGLASLGLAVVLTGCKYAPGGGVFAVPQNYVDVAPDARLDGEGRRTEVDQDLAGNILRTGRPIHDAEDVRFPMVSAADVVLIAGRSRLDDYLILAVVHAGDSGTIGTNPRAAADDLRRGASLIGADAVLDVRRASWAGGGLVGLAARRRREPSGTPSVRAAEEK